MPRGLQNVVLVVRPVLFSGWPFPLGLTCDLVPPIRRAIICNVLHPIAWKYIFGVDWVLWHDLALGVLEVRKVRQIDPSNTSFSIERLGHIMNNILVLRLNIPSDSFSVVVVIIDCFFVLGIDQ